MWSYPLKFWCKNSKDTSKMIESNKRKETGSNFTAALTNRALSFDIVKNDWVTNHKELWTSLPLKGHPDGVKGTQRDSETFRYMQPNGKEVSDMHFTTTFLRTYDNIEQTPKRSRLGSCGSCSRSQCPCLTFHVPVQRIARPAHYHVLLDEMNLGKDVPEITLILCTTFGRATKVVSYAGPAYMADILCERGRVCLRLWANDEVGPKWLSDDLKNGDGTPFTKDQFKERKKARALQLLRDSRIWGGLQ